MTATNFNEALAPKINAVLKHALNSKYSNFYRNKYAKQAVSKITSYEDFLKLPVLGKDEILAVNYEDRLFAPEKNIKYFSFSSGTTHHNRPSIIPHSTYNMDSNLPFPPYVSRLMVLTSITIPMYVKFAAVKPAGTMVIPGDIHNLGLMARIIDDIKINGLSTSPTVLGHLLETANSTGCSLSSLKWVRLGTEPCSRQKAAFFRKQLPKAFVTFSFGVSELGGLVGYQCEHLTSQPKPNVFHVHNKMLLEILDANNQPLPLGKIGFVVCTPIKDRPAFPLIRYKLGDMGRLEKKPCKCGQDYIFVAGSKGVPVGALRFHGVSIRSDMIKQAISSIKQFEPAWEMHIQEENNRGKLMPKITLIVRIKTQHNNLKKDSYFSKISAEKISEALLLSAHVNLSQLVEQSVFMPLELVLTDKKQLANAIISEID